MWFPILLTNNQKHYSGLLVSIPKGLTDKYRISSSSIIKANNYLVLVHNDPSRNDHYGMETWGQTESGSKTCT